MSQLNGNDIDDLFRRASDKYPLRTDSADWDRLAADLEKDPSLILAPMSDEGDKRRRKRFFWLFLLLPLAGIGYYVGHPAGHGSNSQPVVTRSQQQKGSNSETSSSPALRPLTSIPSSINPNSSSIPSGGATAASGREIATRTPERTLNTSGSDLTASDLTASDLTASDRSASDRSAGNRTTQNRVSASRTAPNGTAADRTIIDQFAADRSGNYPSGSGTRKSSAKESKTDGIAGVENEGTSLHPLGPHSLQLARMTNGVALDVNVQSKNAPAAEKTTKLAKPRNQTHFYAGLVAAPDLSMVKFQSMKGVGTTYGLLLGYNINRKWAIESGLYLDRKKYYTDGEYFSTKNIYMSPNVKISTVDGTCNMWEIPLNVRYNLSQGEKTKWFATAGLSTYLMTKENYSYQLESTSGGATWPFQKQYNTPRNYLFSVVNFSVGYEQKIGKVGNLRIEPYLRVPLSGIGTGSLPIMSAGLNIGITRRIW